MFRVGIGQDSHPFENPKSKKPLVLGGIIFPNEVGIKGNSDSDVILHALFNALSSAIGQESLGVYSDPMCFDQGIIDSSKYLKVALNLVDKAGFKVNNVSVAVEAKKPRFPKQLVQKMQEKIGELCKIPADCVGITATSGENLTPFGKGEGIQVFAIVSLISKNE